MRFKFPFLLLLNAIGSKYVLKLKKKQWKMKKQLSCVVGHKHMIS